MSGNGLMRERRCLPVAEDGVLAEVLISIVTGVRRQCKTYLGSSTTHSAVMTSQYDLL